MSSLPIAQWCSAAGVLGDKHGAGRAAAISTAHHAVMAGADDADELMARLSPDEQTEVRRRKTPADVDVGGATLSWMDDTHPGGREVEVILDANLDCEGEPVSIGHVDRYWVIDGIVYVADIKATDWSSPDGPDDSLQMHAYGLACAALHDADGYCLGHWNATEGEWDWTRIYEIGFDTMEIGERVLAAARNTSGEYATGSHCHSCYQRLHCQEWLAPIEAGDNAFLQIAAGTEVSMGRLAEAVDQMKVYEGMVELVKAALKVHADRIGGIVSSDGKKIWKAGAVKGRKGLDKKALEADHPGLLAKYEKRGPDTTRYSWRNNK